MLMYIVVVSAVFFLAYSIYAQVRLSPLIDYIRQSPSMTKAIGDVSDLYYLFTMPRGNYRFALYLWHNPTPPDEIASNFADYDRLRIISNIAFLFHLGLGFLIFSSVALQLLLKH
ncbi:hypothetical protein Brsp04_01634 [Brucella sp. NBRC 12952]|jgi:hypothetical protein